MPLPLPYKIVDPTDTEAVQGNFDALAKEFPLSRKNMQVEGIHEVNGGLGPPEQPNFDGTWVNFDTSTFTGARFWKDPMGLVHLEGVVKDGSGGFPRTIFTLPSGYLPALGHIYAVATDTGLGRVDVAPTGEVLQQAGGTGYLSLDGIAFKQES